MILEYLKTKTRHLHDAVEEELGARQMLGEDYSLEHYKTLLSRLWHAHSTVEPAIQRYDSIMNNHLLQPDVRLNKRHLIADDLKNLSHPVSSLPSPFRFDNIREAWGAMYVLEGSSLGGHIIYKHLRKNNWEVKAFKFYNCYGENTGKMWNIFKKVLTEQNIADEDTARDLVRGAEKAYEAFLMPSSKN